MRKRVRRFRLPYRPRWLNKWFAWFCGYFWLPCPICGDYFGGHEWLNWNHCLYRADGSGSGTCPKCPVLDARKAADGVIDLGWKFSVADDGSLRVAVDDTYVLFVPPSEAAPALGSLLAEIGSRGATA